MGKRIGRVVRHSRTFYALLSAAAVSVACVLPLPNPLPSSERADRMGRVRSPSYSLDPPPGRWRVVSLRGIGAIANAGGFFKTGDLPTWPLGLVATAFNTDSVLREATMFCHVPKIAVAGDGTVARGPDRCLAVVAQSLPATFADSGVALERLRETVAARSPNRSGYCHSKGGNDYRYNRLEPVRVGSTRFYLLAQRCDSDSALVSDPGGKVLLRITSARVYSFFFSDPRSGPGSDEWRVLTSFTPSPPAAP